jgi:hypothetical protein
VEEVVESVDEEEEVVVEVEEEEEEEEEAEEEGAFLFLSGVSFFLPHIPERVF